MIKEQKKRCGFKSRYGQFLCFLRKYYNFYIKIYFIIINILYINYNEMT